jgi:hypothetical protein
MTGGRVNFGRVNDAAQNAGISVLRAFLPDGIVQGSEYVATNPTRSDNRRGSFKVNIATFKWADFATGDRGGDPVALVAFVCGLPQREAAIRLAEALGVNPYE